MQYVGQIHKITQIMYKSNLKSLRKGWFLLSKNIANKKN